ncbi:MAG: glycosyltransferase family 39 protein [Candidatus Levyibacteriota bacterium]|nr:MAG: glycosyltransferase family 39 protein [Candidatus Levybacteria bacterium]
MSKLFFLLALLFLFTRLYNLTLLPIFTDEAIYIYWAKYIATFHSHFFMSLTDGKPPLFIWFIALLLQVFPQDIYLAAGRLISVIAGGATIVGIYKLTNLLFSSKKIAYLAVFFSIMNPFMLLYDRLALYDSLLSAFLLWSVYFAVKTASTLAKKDALLWGLFLGLGFLTKPPAVIFALLTPLCFFVLIWRKHKITKIVLLPLIAVGIAELMNSIQRFSFNYQLMVEKNQKFQLPVNELFSAPFYEIGKNFNELSQWIIAYYTIPIFIAGVIGLLVILYKDFRKGSLLFILWFVPIIIFATVGKILFPRYILFTTPYFLIAISAVLYQIKVAKVRITLLIFLFFLSLQFDYFLITNPTKASLPLTDYNQYITSEYSGYGLDKTFAFLDKELDNGPRITLITEGKFGLFPYAFMLEYWHDPRITIIPSWIPDKNEFDLYNLAKSAKALVVFSRQKDVPKSYPLRLVLKAEKPGRRHPILLTTLQDR